MKIYCKKIVAIVVILLAVIGVGAIQNSIIANAEALAQTMSLNKSSISLAEGDSEQLTLVTTTAAAAQVTWVSSDESVVTVNSDGKVKAVKEGHASITATINDGNNLSATCLVTVSSQPVLPAQGSTATLTINLTNGMVKQYELSNSELDDFLNWYDSRSNGTGKTYYTFTSKASSQYKNKTDYIAFDKINDYEVQEHLGLV